MNGRIAKKIRKQGMIAVDAAARGYIAGLLSLTLYQRLTFCFALLFKRKWEP
jgi:hypothetical protein